MPEPPTVPFPWHILKLDALAGELRSDPETGLTKSEVQQRLALRSVRSLS